VGFDFSVEGLVGNVLSVDTEETARARDVERSARILELDAGGSDPGIRDECSEARAFRALADETTDGRKKRAELAALRSRVAHGRPAAGHTLAVPAAFSGRACGDDVRLVARVDDGPKVA